MGNQIKHNRMRTLINLIGRLQNKIPQFFKNIFFLPLSNLNSKQIYDVLILVGHYFWYFFFLSTSAITKITDGVETSQAVYTYKEIITPPKISKAAQSKKARDQSGSRSNIQGDDFLSYF